LLIRYILDADIDKADFDRKVASVSNLDLRSNAMTLAQQFRQEGRQEGRMIILQENVIDALDIRFGEVPQGLRETILGIREEAILRAHHRAAIQATSLEDFSRSL